MPFICILFPSRNSLLEASTKTNIEHKLRTPGLDENEVSKANIQTVHSIINTAYLL